MTLTLGEQLGKTGGYASVFRAQQNGDGRTIIIAVKVYLERGQHSLPDELEMLNAVHGHPNVLECLGEDMLEPDQVPPPSEKGHNHGRRCLKLPCLKPRGDLFHIAFPGPLGIADVQGFARQMVAGVEHIHLCGVAHLDIKPNNMLVDANGTLKISDFGLARWTHLVGSDLSSGTDGYVAPEISNRTSLGLTGAVDGLAADVWSLGVTILFLSVRCNPFRRLDYRAVGRPQEPRDEYVIRRRNLYLGMRIQQTQGGINGVLAACCTIGGLAALFRALPPDLQTLLDGMLYIGHIDQMRRLTIQQVAASPWITGAVPAPTVPAPAAPAPTVPAPAIPAPTAAFGATSTSSTAYRGLGAAADDEAEQPRWNACSASALDEAEADDLPAIPPPEWANASSLILD